MDNLAIIILAAGLGKRIGLSLPKAILETSEKPLVQHVLETSAKLQAERTVVVVGHQREKVESLIKEAATSRALSSQNLHFATQEQQKGTGDAVRSALPFLSDFKGLVLILYADVPLIKASTLEKFIDFHLREKATISLLSFSTAEAGAYGRLLRDKSGRYVERVIEARDCSSQQLAIGELNSGIYLVDSSFLEPAVQALSNDNSQKEYYLTDIIERASKEGQTVLAYPVESWQEVQGVNDLYDLAQVNQSLNQRRVRNLILSGVRVLDPQTLILDPSVSVEPGAHIGPSTQLFGQTRIAKGVVIEGCCYIKDCIIEEGAQIKLGVRAEGASIGKHASVGPFANLRPKTKLAEHVKIGNFVETKSATLAPHAKASHLSYLGDCNVGENSNIGAGTITCNYDGFKKHQTEIGDNVFIGSNSSLVAPVVIEAGATVGAGSVITKRVEKDSLALSRAPQISKSAWSKRKRETRNKSE